MKNKSSLHRRDNCNKTYSPKMPSLSFRRVGNVTLNIYADPTANPKDQLESSSHGISSWKCNSLWLLLQYDVGCWEKLELLCPPLSAVGFWLFSASRNRLSCCRVPQFSKKGRIPFPWVRAFPAYSCTAVRPGASITYPVRSCSLQGCWF